MGGAPCAVCAGEEGGGRGAERRSGGRHRSPWEGSREALRQSGGLHQGTAEGTHGTLGDSGRADVSPACPPQTFPLLLTHTVYPARVTPTGPGAVPAPPRPRAAGPAPAHPPTHLYRLPHTAPTPQVPEPVPLPKGLARPVPLPLSFPFPQPQPLSQHWPRGALLLFSPQGRHVRAPARVRQRQQAVQGDVHPEVSEVQHPPWLRYWCGEEGDWEWNGRGLWDWTKKVRTSVSIASRDGDICAMHIAPPQSARPAPPIRTSRPPNPHVPSSSPALSVCTVISAMWTLCGWTLPHWTRRPFRSTTPSPSTF